MKFTSGNLYRFMAITGTILLFACIILQVTYIEWINSESNQLRRNLVQFTQERESMIQELKVYEEGPAIPDSLMTRTVSAKNQQVIEKYRSEIDLRTRQLNLENELLEQLQSRKKYSYYGIAAALALGFIALIAGLLGWYLCIQRPVNQLIRREIYREPEEKV